MALTLKFETNVNIRVTGISLSANQIENLKKFVKPVNFDVSNNKQIFLTRHKNTKTSNVKIIVVEMLKSLNKNTSIEKKCYVGL